MGAINFLRRAHQKVHYEWRQALWHIHRRLRKSVTVCVEQGRFSLALAGEDPIGRSLYIHGEFEKDLMTHALTFLRETDRIPAKGQGTLLDIGANTGVTSISLLNSGEVGRAIAIEPEPTNFQLLQRNVEQNTLLDRVTCLPYAASDTTTSVAFELSPKNFGDHRVRTCTDTSNADELYAESDRQVIHVQADSVDNLLKRTPQNFQDTVSLVWIDVQGHEGYVFRGAQELLSRGLPVVSEIWPYGIWRAGLTQDEFISIIREFWSSYWVLRRGKFVRYPIDVFDTLFAELGYGEDFENVIFTK